MSDRIVEVVQVRRLARLVIESRPTAERASVSWCGRDDQTHRSCSSTGAGARSGCCGAADAVTWQHFDRNPLEPGRRR